MKKVLLTRLVVASLLALSLNFIETSQAKAASPCSNVDINYYINDAKNLKLVSRTNGPVVLAKLREGNQNNYWGIMLKALPNQPPPEPKNKAEEEALDAYRKSPEYFDYLSKRDEKTIELFKLVVDWANNTKDPSLKSILLAYSKKPRSHTPTEHYTLLIKMRNKKFC